MKRLSLAGMLMVTETPNIFRVSKIKNKTKIISSLKIDEVDVSDPSHIPEHVYFQLTLFCRNMILWKKSFPS